MNDNFHKGSVKQERPVYSYEDTPNDNDNGLDADSGSDSPDSRNGGKDNDNKSKKKYSVIPQSVREKFIKRVLSKEVTIKEAAKEFGLKFSTSKAILQTYKKEGRIGKKKNRERKTKVVNVVFVCNINPMNPYASNIFPIVSVNEIKGAKATTNAEENKNKLVEQTLANYPEHKIVHQTNLQIPNDSNKSTQQFIKELGNDFLKDFIEKNFNPAKGSSASSMNGPVGGLQSSVSNTTQGSLGTNASMSNVIMPNMSNMPPPTFNGMSNIGGPGFMQGQQTQQFTMGDMMGTSQMNQMYQQNLGGNYSLNQKRSFQNYDNRDTIPELELKSEQINDISAKKFKSGEDALWDYDMDRSKQDLEDFIYKTHNAIKNNTYIGKTVTFDFSKYKEDFAE